MLQCRAHVQEFLEESRPKGTWLKLGADVEECQLSKWCLSKGAREFDQLKLPFILPLLLPSYGRSLQLSSTRLSEGGVIRSPLVLPHNGTINVPETLSEHVLDPIVDVFAGEPQRDEAFLVDFPPPPLKAFL